jgi:hypothetical protein
MRFRSTLVITFLVPILALLASVRAAPPSGLQSRDDNPFSINWAEPVFGQNVKRGKPLYFGVVGGEWWNINVLGAYSFGSSVTQNIN